MASRTAEAHIELQRRLRQQTAQAVSAVWIGLASYDEDDVQAWLERALPVVLGAQRTSAALTQAYLASAIGRQLASVSPDQVTGAAIRNGTSPETVYRRPFVTVWTALGAGKDWADAVNQGLTRATSTAETDVQLSSRAAFGAVQEANPQIRGYRRVPDAGACAYCLAIAGAFVKSADASPLHNRCGCSLEPIVGESVEPTPTPEDVDVHEHGELGPVLAAPGDNFTSEGDL